MKHLLIVMACSIALVGCSAREVVKHTANTVATAVTGISEAGEAASWAVAVTPDPEKSEDTEE